MNMRVKIESMGRVASSLAVAGLLGVLVGCAAHLTGGDPKGMTKPSTMPLDIDFMDDPGSEPPTEIVVSPNGGDLSLEAVPERQDEDNDNDDKNWVTWSADRSFAIKFGPIDDACTEPGKKFGNEKDGWNDSKPVGNQHVYKLKLNPGKGTNKKEILVGKYSVKSPAGCEEKHPGPNCLVLDPVIIVRY